MQVARDCWTISAKYLKNRREKSNPENLDKEIAAFQMAHRDVFPNRQSLILKIREVRQRTMANIKSPLLQSTGGGAEAKGIIFASYFDSFSLTTQLFSKFKKKELDMMRNLKSFFLCIYSRPSPGLGPDNILKYLILKKKNKS